VLAVRPRQRAVLGWVCAGESFLNFNAITPDGLGLHQALAYLGACGGLHSMWISMGSAACIVPGC
jgi:hypothetical protein